MAWLTTAPTPIITSSSRYDEERGLSTFPSAWRVWWGFYAVQEVLSDPTYLQQYDTFTLSRARTVTTYEYRGMDLATAQATLAALTDFEDATLDAIGGGGYNVSVSYDVVDGPKVPRTITTSVPGIGTTLTTEWFFKERE
jgi:hypothetical protein